MENSRKEQVLSAYKAIVSNSEYLCTLIKGMDEGKKSMLKAIIFQAFSRGYDLGREENNEQFGNSEQLKGK